MFLRLFRDVILTAINAFLIVSMSGWFELARAASCNDTWYTTFAGVTYKYSDKLANFTSYNGKTYAYAKTNSLGAQEKITTGVNNGRASLYGMQAMIASTYPGASLPKITDGGVQKMLTDVFGPLITAAGQTSIYVGEMNKNDGSGYVNMDGSGPATYYNWLPGQPNPAPGCKSSDGVTGKDPYTIMKPDGTWKTACDGSSAPLFEFQGVFDCAVPYTGTGTTPGTGASNIATGPVGSLKACDTTNYEKFGIYSNITYAITKNPLSWPAAKALAETSGGKLAYIGNQGANDYLVSQFGPLMAGSVNVTGSKAWIGMSDPASVASWCMPGTTPCPTMPSRFQWLNDVSSYSNWSAGQPDNYCTVQEIAANIDHNCFGENWVAMGTDGKWSDEGDHGYAPVTLKAIVQWKDQMSCTTTITPPPPPPPAGGDLGLNQGDKMCTDSSKLALKYCDKADPSGTMTPTSICPTGYTFSSGSCTAPAPCPQNVCTVAPTLICPAWAKLDANGMCVSVDDQLCPLEKTLCTDMLEPPQCPGGGVIELGRDMCQLDPVVTCPSPYTWDKTIDRCVLSVTCPENGNFNQITQRCEKIPTSTCPPNYVLDQAAGICTMAATCPSGGTFSSTTDRCEMPPTWVCASPGYTYNSVSKFCEMVPNCPAGSTYSATTQRCEQSPGNCPPNYVYNNALNTCTAAATCPNGGVFTAATNTCEQAGTPTCQSGWVFNPATSRCEQPPSCAAPGVYDPASDLCLAVIAGATCPANYIYDPATKSCTEQPACTSGTFNPGTNRCEESPGCASGYSYNTTSGRCEQIPPNCPSGYTFSGALDACTASVTCTNGGTLNSTTNLCELQVTLTCNAGWMLNSSTSKCEKTPVCLSPGTYSSTGKYCVAPVTSITCPSGYVWDAAKNACTETPVCVNGTFNAATNQCESAPSCPAGTTLNVAAGRCEVVPDNCPSGYTYSSAENKCIVVPSCTGGTYDGATGQCTASATPTCEAGWTYNSGSAKCEQAPFCASPGTYNSATDTCSAGAGTLSCPSNYSYDVGSLTCKALPLCPAATTYSPATKSCQAPVSYTCSDASYAYNVGSGRCEKTPVCAIGTYNTTYNKCLQPEISTTCGTGYIYNPTRARCEFQPPTCPVGSTYDNATNKCVKAASTTTGYSSTVTGSTRKVKYKQRGNLNPWDYSFSPVYQDTIQYTFDLVNGQVQLTDFCAWGGAGNNGCAYPNWNWDVSRKIVMAESRGGGWVSETANLWYTGQCCDQGGTPNWVSDEYGTYLTCTGGYTCGYDGEGNYSCWNSNYPVGTCPSSIAETSAVCAADISEFVSCPPGSTLTAPIGTAACTAILTTWGTATGLMDCSGANLYTCTSSIQACPVGTTMNGGGSCDVANPTCAGGNFDGVLDVCWMAATKVCPDGMLYDSAIGYCATPATCTNGLLDGGTDVCYQATSVACPTGSALVGGVCTATPTCSGGGTFSSALDACTAGASYACTAPGYTYDSVSGNCLQTPGCGSGLLNTVTDVCQTTSTLVCPADFTLSGSSCQKTPVCLPGGILNVGTGSCEVTGGACSTGLALDPVTDKCFAAGTCVSGMTNSGAVCSASAICGTGGTLNVALGLCTSDGTFNCDPGYAYSSAANTCFQTADCGTGGLNAATNLCEMSNTPTCPGGYAVNGSTCQVAPDCGAGSTYDATSKSCLSATPPCAGGATLDTLVDMCFVSPTCSSGYTVAGSVCSGNANCSAGGGLDTATSVCRGAATFSCDPGYAYSPVSGKCFVAAICTPGSLDIATDVCVTPNTLSCPSGFTLNGTVCQIAPTCGNGGVYNPVTSVCDGGADVCPTSWTLDTTTDVCHQLSTCPGGTFDAASNKCTSIGTATCPDPGGVYTFDATSELCITPPVCVPGTYDAALNQCKLAIVPDCGTYALDVSTGVCNQPVSCPQDPAFSLNSSIAFAPSINMCASDAQHDCAAPYAYNGMPVVKCETVPVCQRGVYNPTTDSCSTGTGNCPVGDYSCMSLVGDTDINPATGQKYLYCSPNSCTADTQSMITNDDTTTGENDVINDGETDQYGNCLSTLYLFNGKDMRCRVYDRNGQINSYAKLVAQIILAATGVGAALAGAMALTGFAATVATAAINAAIQIATTVVIDAGTGQLGQGTMMACAMTAVAAVASIAGSYMNGVGQFQQGATTTTVDTSTGLSTSVTGISQSTVAPVAAEGTVAQATQGMTLVSSNGGQSIYSSSFSSITGSGDLGGTATMVTVTTAVDGMVTVTTQAVTTSTASMSALLQAQAMQLADQWGPTITSGMLSNYSATRCCYPDPMKASCEPDEFKEAKMQHDKWCHVVGRYCSSKFLGWCIVEKETSCCFNSMLARIFHEQGRPQLKTFNGWGTPKSPKCRGFVPEEFQNLDFAQMDLSEYIDKIAQNVEAIGGAITDYMNSVQQGAGAKAQQQMQQNPAGL